MEGDERSALIACGKLAAGIKRHVHRGPMCRIAGDRKRESAAASYDFAIAAIFRIKQELLLGVSEKAVGPAKIKSQGRTVHWLGGAGGILLSSKFARPQNVQLVAAVHDDINGAIVPGDGRFLAQSSDKLLSVSLFLVQFIFVKLPDAAVGFE